MSDVIINVTSGGEVAGLKIEEEGADKLWAGSTDEQRVNRVRNLIKSGIFLGEVARIASPSVQEFEADYITETN